jgi:hypothetical protein
MAFVLLVLLASESWYLSKEAMERLGHHLCFSAVQLFTVACLFLRIMLQFILKREVLQQLLIEFPGLRSFHRAKTATAIDLTDAR